MQNKTRSIAITQTHMAELVTLSANVLLLVLVLVLGIRGAML